MKPAPPILEADQLRLLRGTTAILKDVSWTVIPGQHWVILGPNGCGKTSLLRTLTGYLSATSGRIGLLGRRYGETDWRDLRREIGVVTSAFLSSIPPAEKALETVISGKYAQLDLWAKPAATDKDEAQQWLKDLGMAPLAQREWLYLSQGERQRVLIARALMARPKLLILDEPCSGLDPIAREHFLAFVQGLAARRASPSLVLVTHHVEEIVPAFSHALLLRAGSVVRAGPVKSVLTSRWLTETFGQPVRLQRIGARHRLQVLPASRRRDP